MRKEIKRFLYKLYNYPGISIAARQKLTELMIRDAMNGVFDDKLKTMPKEWILDVEQANSENTHDPKFVAAFLNQFTLPEKALKYTTHSWEKLNDGSYRWKDFDSFFNDYQSELKSEPYKLDKLKSLNIHLYFLIHNFLLPNREKRDHYFWGEYRDLQIGYCNPEGWLKRWMNENPNKQPLVMPLSFLPEENQPKGRIKGRDLIYFDDVVELFKHSIEFRDNDLYFAIKEIFRSPDLSISEEDLEHLKGISFYTDTSQIKEALVLIADNIKNRPQYPNVVIKSQLLNFVDDRCIELTILQVNSFSEKTTDDDKLMLVGGKGQIIGIKEKLKSLADFSIESFFRHRNERCACRIDYLYNNDFNSPPRVTKLDSDCEGFKYILKFYF